MYSHVVLQMLFPFSFEVALVTIKSSEFLMNTLSVPPQHPSILECFLTLVTAFDHLYFLMLWMHPSNVVLYSPGVEELFTDEALAIVRFFFVYFLCLCNLDHHYASATCGTSNIAWP